LVASPGTVLANSFRRQFAAPYLFLAMRNYTLVLALATSALLGCQSKSPEEEILQQAQPAGSWIATLRFAGEQWIANRVPASFVESTAEAASDELDKAVQEAGKSPVRPEIRLPLQRLMTDTRSAGAGLERAVDAGDRPGAARQVARLATLQQELAAWRKGAAR
jgi:hypothetical protein